MGRDFPRFHQYTGICRVWLEAGSTPVAVIWVLPSELRSPLPCSASIIPDFSCSTKLRRAGPAAKRSSGRVSALGWWRREPIWSDMRCHGHWLSCASPSILSNSRYERDATVQTQYHESCSQAQYAGSSAVLGPT